MAFQVTLRVETHKPLQSGIVDLAKIRLIFSILLCLDI